MSDFPQATKDRFSGALKDRLRAVVDDLNLDINDPFTKLLAHAISVREAYEELKGELKARPVMFIPQPEASTDQLREALRLIEDHHNENEEWRDIARRALNPPHQT